VSYVALKKLAWVASDNADPKMGSCVHVESSDPGVAAEALYGELSDIYEPEDMTVFVLGDEDANIREFHCYQFTVKVKPKITMKEVQIK
jgi:hypothetical protein